MFEKGIRGSREQVHTMQLLHMLILIDLLLFISGAYVLALVLLAVALPELIDC